MTEASESVTQKEPESYSPQETHRKWYEKAASAGSTAFFYAVSTAQATVAGIMAERAVSVKTHIETINEIAQHMGGTISPESINQIATSARVNEAAAVLAGIGAVAFFGIGTLKVIKSASREK